MIKLKMMVALVAIAMFAGYVSAGSIYYDELKTETSNSIIGDYNIVSVPLGVAVEITERNIKEEPKPSIENDYGLINYSNITTISIDSKSGDKEKVDVVITYPKDIKAGDEYQGTISTYLYTSSNATFMIPLFIKMGALSEVIPEETLVDRSLVPTTTVTTTTKVVNETAKGSDPIGDFVDGFLGFFGL
jgi:hypothetical protein